MSRKRCACSSGRGPRCAAIRPRIEIELGPRASGVYARFSAGGATLTLLNEQGARRAHAHRRRGPRRRHALRRRSARVGRHRHRRRRCPAGGARVRAGHARAIASRWRSRPAASRCRRPPRSRRETDGGHVAHSRPFFYRRLASPLHAARAGVGAMWALALTAAALLLFHPLILLALTLAVLGAGYGAGVGRQLARTLRTAAIVVVPIVAINVLVSRDGLTVFARLGDLGPFGQGDLTVEAARVRGGDRAEGHAADPRHDAREPRGGPRRAAARAAPAVVSLRAHRLARDSHDPAARRRLRAPGRGPAHPSRRRSDRRLARASPCSAPSSVARSIARWTSPRRSSCAASPRPARGRAVRLSRFCRVYAAPPTRPSRRGPHAVRGRATISRSPARRRARRSGARGLSIV